MKLSIKDSILNKILFFILVGLVNQAWAALDPYDRSKDIRPPSLKEISQGRKEWGIDTYFGSGIVSGNANVTSVSAELDGFKRIGDYTGYILSDFYFMSFNGNRIRNQGIALARVDYHVSEKWRLFTVSSHAFNQYTRLDYRGSWGLGPLYKIEIGPIASGLSLAPIYEYEIYNTAEERRTVRLSCRYLAQVDVSETAFFGFDFFYIPSIQDISNTRVFISVSMENAVYKKTVGLKLAYALDYFSAPILGVLTTDTSFSTSVVIHLGE